MLKNIVFIALITITLSFTYMVTKIVNLSALVGTLEAGNALLNKKHKKLKAQNTSLVSQQKKTKQLVKDHRSKVTTRSMKRASKKMAKASASMIPIAGIAIVAAATADDIQDLCSDIEDARNLEQRLNGETVSASNEEEKYCHESMADELALMADETRANIAKNLKISYQAMTDQAGEIGDNINRFGENYIDSFQEHYSETMGSWFK